MYLTDYRERCLKDVITQLEPGLFKKVTGLSVEDFNMLCSLGVFNAPLMNDAIFKFKRYEDASLTYTGINRHAADEVGGWDTTIRKAQYEKLFYNQQSSMLSEDYDSYSKDEASISGSSIIIEPEQTEPMKTEPSSTASSETVPQQGQTETDVRILLDRLQTGSTVTHKKFGKGEVVKFNSNEKYLYVRFIIGEKKFIFPDAFLMGFLEIG